MIPRRVLVVDPDPGFAASLEEDFRASGYEIETVATAGAAVESVTTSFPALAIVDMHLPDGQATALLRRWEHESPGLVVVLVSSTASLGVVLEALKEGTRPFYSKPVRARTLLGELLPGAVPDPTASHRLGSATLRPLEVDRFFTISPGLLAVSGFDGHFKMLNPAWESTLGWTLDELCSKPYLDFIHPDDRAKARDEAIVIRDGRAVFAFKNRYRCKDGRYRWLEWCATPSPHERLVYGSARDVTKNVDLEVKLRASNVALEEIITNGERLLEESVLKNETLTELGRMREEVSAMLVHDLKNPLSVIMSNYDYLVEDFEGSAACLDAIQDSQSAGRRMLRLLENLVDVARLESGSHEPQTTPVPVTELVGAVLLQRRGLARSRDIAVTLVADAGVVADANGDLLMRVLENILDNAFRHTPGGGRLEVELREVERGIELRVGNSGGPIPVAARTGLFEKYRRDGTQGQGRMNLGLGLYFCRLAIEAQHGTICIEQSERLPTIFCIRLPRGRASA